MPQPVQITETAPAVKGSSFVEILRWRADRQPQRQAYAFLAEDGTASVLTYGMLERRARVLGHFLRERRARGARVLLLLPPGLEYVCAFFGCLCAGAVAVPAYPPRRHRSSGRIRAIARDSQASFALTSSRILDGAAAWLLADPVLAGLEWLATDTLDEPAETPAPPLPAAESLALLQYTSGSTADPKGVMVRHADLLSNSALIRRCFDQHSDCRLVSWLPPYHDMGLIGGLLQPLYAGFPATLMAPMSFLRRPVRWLEVISQVGATTSGGPDFAYELCARKLTPEVAERLDLSTWEVAFSGAEPIRPETLERFARALDPCGFRRQAFFPCYGLAEATLFVSGGEKHQPPRLHSVATSVLDGASDAATPPAGNTPTRTLVGCGKPPSELTVAIVDPATAQRCPPGRVGEVWVTGPGVAGGYWRRDEETAAVFGARLEGGAEAYLRTGDLALLCDGELVVTGRLKDLIIVRGRNVYPQDIEDCVADSHPALHPGGGGAFAIERGGEERLVLVHEVTRRTRAGTVDDVAAALRQAVAQSLELRLYDVVLIRRGTLPRTSSGKIQRYRCRELYLAGELDVVARHTVADGEPSDVELLDRDDLLSMPAAARRASLENDLARTVARILRLDPSTVERSRPLTGLGLDSLAAIELKNQVEERFGVVLPFACLFEDESSLAQLAARVLDSSEGPAAPPVASVSTPDEPLTAGQGALWLLHRLAPESAAYHVINGARIRGDLDTSALRRALQDLVDRHAALRTTFPAVDGRPVQRVHPVRTLELDLVDARSWNPKQLTARWRAAAEQPFDLESGPLLRSHLYRLADEHLLILAMHHIITDFWSLEVLLDELRVLYPAARMGRPVPLAAPEIRYTDYVSWQKEQLAGPRGERLRSYWEERLAGASPTLEMPTDRPRPPVRSDRGAALPFELERPLIDALQRRSREAGVTLFTTLLAGFQVLLHRASRQPDILVGVPTAGRDRAALARLVGYFVNPVVLRGDLAGDPDFSVLLSRLRDTVLGAFAHQDYPFATLVDRLQPQRDPSRTPLVQAMLTFHREHLREQSLVPFALGRGGARIALGDLELESLAFDPRVAQFDLSLTLGEVDGRLLGTLDYNRDLFDRVTIARLALQLRSLFAAVAEDPRQPLPALPLSTPAERHQALVEWQDTATPPATGCIPDLVAAEAARRSEAVAVRSRAGALSFRELVERARDLASRLARRGVGPETPVGLYLERSLDLVVGLLGILEAGGAWVPLDPDHPVERVREQLRDARVRVLVSGGRLPDELAGELTDVVRPAVGSPDGARAGAAPPMRLRAANPACVIYTSGSTGRPKGVVIEHRALINLIRSFLQSYGAHPGDRVLPLTSVASASFVGEVMPILCAGGCVVLPTKEEMLTVTDLPARIARHRVSIASTVPAFASRLNARSMRELAGLRLLLVGGEALLPSQVGELCRTTTVVNGYGITEATICSTFHVLNRSDHAASSSLPVGRPLINSRVHVLGADLTPQPIGWPGELLIGGLGLARGYLDDPRRTAARFVPDPHGAGERLYRTGDLGRRRHDGNLEVLGRVDKQVKIRGYRIELGEIEAALGRHPAVRDAVVVARGEGGHRQLVAYVVAQPPQEGEEWRRFLADRLPDYMIPTFFEPLDALPLSPNGKVDPSALPPPSTRRRSEGDDGTLRPRSGLERTVAGIWEGILAVENPGRDDNFFDLGGNSLLMSEVHAQLRERLEMKISLIDLFRYPTIRAVAGFLKTARPDRGSHTIEDARTRADQQRSALARQRATAKQRNPNRAALSRPHSTASV